ncbi:MAG TPA: hypothetical protein VID48_09325 [Solirubrobacteraceae bacterium]
MSTEDEKRLRGLLSGLGDHFAEPQHRGFSSSSSPPQSGQSAGGGGSLEGAAVNRVWQRRQRN